MDVKCYGSTASSLASVSRSGAGTRAKSPRDRALNCGCKRGLKRGARPSDLACSGPPPQNASASMEYHRLRELPIHDDKVQRMESIGCDIPFDRALSKNLCR